MRWVIKEGGYWACWPLWPCWAEGPARDGPWGQFTLRRLIRWAWLHGEASPILHAPSALHLTLTCPDWNNYGCFFSWKPCVPFLTSDANQKTTTEKMLVRFDPGRNWRTCTFSHLDGRVCIRCQERTVSWDKRTDETRRNMMRGRCGTFGQSRCL